MVVLSAFYIIASIFAVLFSVIACITYDERVNKTYIDDIKDNKNYNLWKEHGTLLSVMIISLVTLWCIISSIAMFRTVDYCADQAAVFFDFIFMMVGTILMIFCIFREVNLGPLE